MIALPDRAFSLRRIRFITVLGLGLLGIIGCGGGGSGGDDVAVSDDPAPALPSKAHYYIGGPGGNPETSGFTYTIDEATVSVSLALGGSYTKADRGYTLDASPVARMEVNSSNLRFDLLQESFAIRVDETLQWHYGEHPAAGRFSSFWNNYVSVAVNNNVSGSGEPGVDIQYVAFDSVAGSASLTWDEFDAVLNDPAAAPLYQVQAAFTYLIMTNVYQSIQFIMDSFDTIRLQESALEAAGSGNGLSFSCDQLDGETGSRQLTWSDGPGEIAEALGPADAFMWSFTNCWRNDTALLGDVLYESGTIALNDYNENANPVRLAFEDVGISDLIVTATTGDPGAVTRATSINVDSFSSGDRSGIYVEVLPDTSGTINLVTVYPVVEVGTSALTGLFQYGEYFVDLLEEVAADSATDGSVSCDVSGSLDYHMGANPVVSGSAVSFSFNNCVISVAGNQLTITGDASMTVNMLTGILAANDIYTIDTVLAFNNLGLLDDVGLVVTNGAMNFSREANSGIFVEAASSVAAQPLSQTEAGVTTTLTTFATEATVSATTLTIGQAGDVLTLEYSGLSGPLTLEVLATLEGSAFPAMYSGSFRITASDSTSVTTTVSSSGETSLAVDSDGDGTADDTLLTNWEVIY